MTKKKKTNSGNPAKRSRNDQDLSSILDRATAAAAYITDPLELSSFWDSITPEVFDRSSDAQKGKLVTTLFRNQHTPVQVLWDIDSGIRRMDNPGFHKTFWDGLENRWAMTPPDKLPPILGRKHWMLDARQLGLSVEKLKRIVNETEQPTCLAAAWEFAKEHLIEAKPSNLPELLEAFESNPASPAEVVADAMAQAVLG